MKTVQVSEVVGAALDWLVAKCEGHESRCAVELAIEAVHMHIASCPNVEEYAEDIEVLEQDKQVFKDLLLRIDKKLESI